MTLLRKLDKLRGKAGSIRARSLSAAIWSFGGMGVQRGLSLVSNLIMTRFLAPEDFGLMAIVLSVLLLTEMMSDIGIRQSIVRSEQGENLRFLQVAWTVQIVRTSLVAFVVVLIALGLWLMAPFLEGGDSVYADPQLPALISLASVGVILVGLQSVGIFVETRNLRQKQLVTIDIGTQVVTLIFMVVLVQISPTVWVLLWGLLIGRVIRTVWTHLAFRGTPMRLVWDTKIASDLWQFGRWLIGSSVAGFVVNNGDRFLMGALLPKETFGFYVIAVLWLQAAVTVLTKGANQVLYPALSEKLRKDRPNFPVAFKLGRRLFDTALFTAFFGVFFFGQPLIDALYLPEYAMSGVFLTLLSFRFLAQRQSVLTMVLLAEGDSKQIMWASIVSALTLLTLVPVIFWVSGVEAAVLVIAVAPSLGTLIVLRGVERHHPGLAGPTYIVMVFLLIGAAALSLLAR